MGELLKYFRTIAINNRGLIPERMEGVYRGKWKDHPKVKSGEWSYKQDSSGGKEGLTSRGWAYPSTSGIINTPGSYDGDYFLIEDDIEALGLAGFNTRFVMEVLEK